MVSPLAPAVAAAVATVVLFGYEIVLAVLLH